MGQIKWSNVCIIVGPEEAKMKEAEKLLDEIMSETFQNLVKEADIQIQEAQAVPNKRDAKKP